MPLMYLLLIPQILLYVDLNLKLESSTKLWRVHFLTEKSLKKLNVVNVDGQWKHRNHHHALEQQQQQEKP